MRSLGELGRVGLRRELPGEAKALGVARPRAGIFAEQAVKGVDQVDRGNLLGLGRPARAAISARPRMEIATRKGRLLLVIGGTRFLKPVPDRARRLDRRSLIYKFDKTTPAIRRGG